MSTYTIAGGTLTATTNTQGQTTYSATLTGETSPRSVWTDRAGNIIRDGEGNPIYGASTADTPARTDMFKAMYDKRQADAAAEATLLAKAEAQAELDKAVEVANAANDADAKAAAEQTAAALAAIVAAADAAEAAAATEVVAAAEAQAQAEAAAAAAETPPPAPEPAPEPTPEPAPEPSPEPSSPPSDSPSPSSSGEPVLIDMDGNGVDLIARSASNVYFDSNGDGFLHHTGWVGKHDAMVVEDLNNDGQITTGAEIAFASRTAQADTDLQALMTLHDTNGDGQVSALDEGFDKLLLWTDANSNGETDAGELQTFAQAGLTSISGNRRIVNYVGGDAVVSAMGTATFDVNGQSITRAVADVSFTVDPQGYKVLGTHSDGSTTVQTVAGKVLVQANAEQALNVMLDTTQDGALGSNLGDYITATKATWINGGAGDDVITGSSADDWLQGGAGSDVINGGTGNDTLVIDAQDNPNLIEGGAGFDTVIVEGAAGVTLDLARATVEAAFGGVGDDVFSTSGPGSVILSGGAGNDRLSGGTGADWLDGGTGADVMLGGAGDDTYIVDNAGDIAAEAVNHGFDTLKTSVSYHVGANFEEAIAWGSAAITLTGNDSGMTLIANNAGDTLIGGAAADTLVGGAGQDTLQGGAGNDTYILQLGGGRDVVLDSAGEADRILVRGSLSASDIALTRSNRDVIVTIKGTTDALVLQNWFTDTWGQLSPSAIESIQFENGSTAIDAHFIQILLDNRAPTAVADTGAAVEDAVAPAIGNVLTNDTDPDLPIDNRQHLTVANVGTFSGAYGQLQLNADGSYSYAVNNSLDAVQALGRNGTLTDTFSYTVQDNAVDNKSATSTLTITIQGTNDGPQARGDVAQVKEDTTISAAGNVLGNDTDIDMGDNLSVATAGVFHGTYGDLTLQASGSYSYALKNTQANVQSLREGQQVVDSFNYTATDGLATSNAVLNVTVTGTNDGPQARGDVAQVTEDTAVSATGNILGNDTDIDIGDTLSVATAGVLHGTYGDLTLQTDGSYRYDLKNAQANVQTLHEGQQVVDSFNYTATDGLATSSATLNVTVTGTNDAPVAFADSVAIQEDATTPSTGNVLTNDVDLDQGTVLKVANAGILTGQYGTLTLNANGAYSYVLNNALASVQSLGVGQTVMDQFNYTVQDDGLQPLTASSTLAITITGTNDAPTVASAITTQSAREKQAFSFVVPLNTFADVDTGDVLTYSALAVNAAGATQALPGWLSFNATTRTFSGTPGTADGGSFDFLVAATDQSSANASTRFTVDIADEFAGTGANLNVITGSWTNDTLNGTSRSETLIGNGGTDKLLAGEGNNTILSMGGDTLITAGSGDDVIISSYGNDTIYAGNGNNRINAGGGNNLIVTGTGDDNINTGWGFSTINAGDGTNTIVATGDSTVVTTGTGADTITTSYGNDTVNSGAGNDIISGGWGADTINAGAGDDIINAGGGGDSVRGGLGNDQINNLQWSDDKYYFAAGDGQDQITDGGGQDMLQLENIASSQLWFAHTGNDLSVSVIGTSDSVTLKNWYLGNQYPGSQYHVEQFKTSDGKTLLDSQVQNLVSAMAAFAPPAAGQTTLTGTAATTLAPVIAANWH